MNNYKKYTNEILDDIQTYELVLQGKIKRFPAYFWERPWSYQSAAEITRYLIEKKLKWSIEDIPKNVDREIFTINRLGGMLHIVFNGSTYKAIDTTYPGLFKPWEFKSVPKNFWNNKDNIIDAVKWLVEEKLKLNNKEEVILMYTKPTLVKHGLNEMCEIGVYNSLNMAYPGVFNPKDFALGNNIYSRELVHGSKITDNQKDSELIINRLASYKKALNNNSKGLGNNYWATEKKYDVAKVVTKYLIEDVLNIEIDSIPKKISTKTFRENKLGGMVQNLFNNSIIKAIENAYPNRFKPWEFNRVPLRFWEDDENIKQAVKWVVEEKLNINTKEQLIEKFTSENLNRYGLSTISNMKGLYGLIDMAYPNRFKPEDFNKYRNR